MSLRAVLYARVSTTEQATEGVSLSAQQRSLIAYCRSQGWSVAEIYVDDGYSGKDLDRPGMHALRAAVGAGKCDVVLVWKVDRVSRRLVDLLDLIQDDLEPRGVAFRSVTESFDTSSPIGKAMLQLLGVFAELERQMIIERVKSGFAELARKGRWLSGRAPYGYRWTDEKELEPDPQTAPGLRLIFERAAAGDGLGRTAGALVAAGFAPPPGASHWHIQSLRKMLNSRVYLGEVRHLGTWTPGTHEPLITPAVWNTAQALRATRHRRPREKSLLSGIADCADCGSRLWAGHTETGGYVYDYYRCREKTCGLRVRQEAADRLVLDAVCRLPFDQDGLRRALGSADDAEVRALRQEDAGLVKSEAEADRRLGGWLSAIEDGAMTFSEVRQRMEELRAQRAHAAGRRREIAVLLQRAAAPVDRGAEVRRELRSFCRDLPRMELPARRAVLRKLVERVTLGRGPVLTHIALR